jgi:predicted molibdopterin-dependent oxidoreductase YjgC
MPADSPFVALSRPERLVPVQVDGKELMLPEGENLAASLLAAGVRSFRETPVSGAPRAPFCMMGACFDCLVEIDGIQRQACMLSVTEGMVISRPEGPVHG